MDISKPLAMLMNKRKLTAYRLAKDINVHQTTIKNWLEGKNVELDNLQKVADYFGVQADYFWERLNPYDREKVKMEAREIVQDQNASLEDRVSAQIRVFKALYSRSNESSRYDPDHVSFDEYVSMLLNQQQFKKKTPPEIYSALVEKYGTAAGIREGLTYWEKDYYHSIKNSTQLKSRPKAVVRYDDIDTSLPHGGFVAESPMNPAYFKVIKNAEKKGYSPEDIQLALDFLDRARKRDDE